MKRLALALLSFALAACASFGSSSSDAVEVVYGNDADENLRKGDEAMESKNYPEAARYYEFVKTKYPYLEAAKTAELKLGDADFERERYVEARDRYQNFVRLHPTHPKVDYAAYRAALTHYKDIPSDFFILPPAAEKDQVEVKNAFSTMSEFARTYPDSPYVKDAEKVLVEVKKRLAEHELYVANFYARRDRWPAVVSRLTIIERFYGGIGYDERVAFGLYDAYRNMKDDAKAREALREFVTKYPQDPAVPRAKSLLGEGGAPVPPAAGAADAGS